MRDVAFRCAWVHRRRKTSVWIGSAEHLHHAIPGHLAVCAATNRRPLGLLSRTWTRIYAAGLCRTRDSAARARPQRRQRQRRFAWSTFRLSGVSKWPLPQIPGMAMGSRTRSGEKHTTSVLVLQSTPPLPISMVCTVVHRIAASDRLSWLPRPTVADRTMRRPSRHPCRVGENQNCAASIPGNAMTRAARPGVCISKVVDKEAHSGPRLRADHPNVYFVIHLL